MKIGIDFHSAEREGSGNCTYIRNLVEALLQIDQENQYLLYVTNISHPYYKQYKDIKNVRLRATISNHPFIRMPILGLNTIIDQIDLLHVQYAAPPIHKGKLVLTIHDICFIHFPECFGKLERCYLKTLVPVNILRASKILTGSQFSLNDIIKKYRASAKKIRAIYDAVKPTLKPLQVGEEEKQVLKGYGISDKYIFFLGRINARKNISLLIKAFIMLKQEEKIPHQLVIAGKKDFLPQKILKNMQASKARKDIIFTGYLQEKYLPIFFNLAEVFIYPSIYEGFGLPCLEAMACGCPVVSLNVSSIPEIVKDAGLLVDNLNSGEIANAIMKILANPALKEELKSRGLQRAQSFTWEKTARETLNTYKEVIK